MSLHLFGIRHHGPGSARSLRQALEALQPDLVLVEGPPDAAEVLPLLAHAEMRPPVALLIYAPEQPRKAVYYPFALFSPEWQALQYALTHDIPARFMDLPQAHQLALEPEKPAEAPPEAPADPGSEEAPEGGTPDATRDDPEALRHDPLGELAATAGYSDGERWWEHLVEQRRESADLFAGILEAMAALRQSPPPREDPLEAPREAFMRQTIRASQKEGFARIAVVCGAWHAPALAVDEPGAGIPTAREDAERLKALPRLKVQATWVPWSYGRLSFASGYGAGIHSPGWYDHLWTEPDQTTIRWMARVARLLREEDLDASAAQVIDAVRLSETLSALRDRPLPGLPELNEATRTVFCFGADPPMRLIHEKLIIGERLGAVPDETPMVPLQQDLLREQRRLRLPAEAAVRTLDLDLRQPNDRERSYLLHRLALIEVPWGQLQPVSGKSGTFHELWRIQWQPELAIALIEAGIWGNRLVDAATARVRNDADRSPDLPALTGLLDRALLADLPEAVRHLMTRLQEEAALASDLTHLMAALPPLARVLRYGNVRQTDTGVVGHVVDGLVARIIIGLPGACASLNDEAAAAMLGHLLAVHEAIVLLQNPEHRDDWHRLLQRLADQHGLHGLLAGRCCRLLLEAKTLDSDEVARRLGLALSLAAEPAQAAAWVEGFLKGSGLLLLHDDRLWQVLDGWVAALPADTFTALLPLLRRTFATFPAPERRAMGDRARRGPARAPAPAAAGAPDFDTARAEALLPLVARLLGVDKGG